jgi:ribosomal protein L17
MPWCGAVHIIKGAKRRLRRSETLDKTVLSKLFAAIAIDGVQRQGGVFSQRY